MPFDNIGTQSESATPQCVDDNCHSELILAPAVWPLPSSSRDNDYTMNNIAT